MSGEATEIIAPILHHKLQMFWILCQLDKRTYPKIPKATVQLVFDEMKVKGGVAYNPKTGRTTSFTTTTSKNSKNMNFAGEIMGIANDSLIYPRIFIQHKNLCSRSSVVQKIYGNLL